MALNVRFLDRQTGRRMAELGRIRPITEGRTNGSFPASHVPDLPFCFRPVLAVQFAWPEYNIREGSILPFSRRSPPSATLEFVATRMKDKYGDPAFRSNEGDLLFWGKPQNSPRCTFAYASATHAQSPIVATWLEKGAPTAWRPANGDKEPNAPGLPAKPAPNSGTSVEDCGPYVTMRFLPAQGYPPMNVIETTLTDMARQEKARVAGARAQKPASAAPIKF